MGLLFGPSCIPRQACKETQQKNSGDHGLRHLRRQACYHATQEGTLPASLYQNNLQQTSVCAPRKAHRLMHAHTTGSFICLWRVAFPRRPYSKRLMRLECLVAHLSIRTITIYGIFKLATEILHWHMYVISCLFDTVRHLSLSR